MIQRIYWKQNELYGSLKLAIAYSTVKKSFMILIVLGSNEASKFGISSKNIMISG